MSKDDPQNGVKTKAAAAAKPGVDADAIRELSALLNETGLTEIEYSAKDWRLRVVRQPAAVTMTAPKGRFMARVAGRLTHKVLSPSVAAMVLTQCTRPR